MRKIYPVVCYDKDQSRAQIFGELGDPIFGRSQSPFNVAAALAVAQNVAEQASIDDCILVEGQPMLCALAILGWLRVHAKANVLLYHSREQEYLLREVLDGDAS